MRTVIEMVRESADPDKVDPFRNGFWVLTQEELERFSELVRKDYSFTHAQMWLKRFDDAILTEREACAGLRKGVALVGKWPTEYEDGFWDALEKYEDLIRERGNT